MSILRTDIGVEGLTVSNKEERRREMYEWVEFDRDWKGLHQIGEEWSSKEGTNDIGVVFCFVGNVKYTIFILSLLCLRHKQTDGEKFPGDMYIHFI